MRNRAQRITQSDSFIMITFVGRRMGGVQDSKHAADLVC